MRRQGLCMKWHEQLTNHQNIARTGLVWYSFDFSFPFPSFNVACLRLQLRTYRYTVVNLCEDLSVLFIVTIATSETPSGLWLHLVPTRKKAITWMHMGSSSYSLIHEDTQVQVIPLRARIEDMRYLNRLSYAGPFTLPESVSTVSHLSLHSVDTQLTLLRLHVLFSISIFLSE